MVAQVGVVLYMFLVGVELNPDDVRHRVRATMTPALASVAVPYALGFALAFSLHARFAPVGVSPMHFALFMGVAMAITAFPVLARILSDIGMTRSDLGVRALTCAAVADIAAWCLLALVIGAVHMTPGSVLVVAAFLAGVAIPHDSRPARALNRWLWAVVTAVLLPAFFAFTGMRTQIDLVSGSDWLLVVLIIGVATAGKFGGTLLGARLAGLRLAHRRRARHPDEHPRPDGIDRAERGPRPRRHLADALHDDGPDGAGDDDGDNACACSASWRRPAAWRDPSLTPPSVLAKVVAP